MTSDTLTIKQPQASATASVPWLGMLGVFVVSLGWFLVGTAGLPLIDRDEPMIAEVARQMVHRGEWLTPHLPAWEYKSIFKPPMAMWLMGLSFKAFGVSEWSARLPSVICSALTATVLFGVGWRRWGRGAGLLAAGCIALPLLPALAGRMALTDPLVVLLATVMLLCLEHSLRVGGSKMCNAGVWVALGLSFLVKGPALLVFLGPALVLTVDRGAWRPYLIFLGGMLLVVLPGYIALPAAASMPLRAIGGLVVLSRVLRWLVPVLRLPVGVLWGAPLAAMVGGWWFLHIGHASATHQQSLERYVGFEVLARIVQPIESHWGPPGYYIVVALVGLLPVSLLLPRMLGWAVRNRQMDSTAPLLVAWVCGSWLLWEVTVTKLPHYILPSLPGLGLLFARWYSQHAEQHSTLHRMAVAWGLGLLVVLAGVTHSTAGRANLSYRAAQQAMAMAGGDERIYAYGYTEPGVFFYLPPDRYERVEDRGALEELGSVQERFVLIVGAKQERQVSERFGPRITTRRSVEGYNAAKARWQTVGVWQVEKSKTEE